MAKGNRIAESIAAAADTAAAYCLIAMRDGDTANYADFARDARAAAITADAAYRRMDAAQIAADDAAAAASIAGDWNESEKIRRDSAAYSRAAIRCMNAAKSAREYADNCDAAAAADDSADDDFCAAADGWHTAALHGDESADDMTAECPECRKWRAAYDTADACPACRAGYGDTAADDSARFASADAIALDTAIRAANDAAAHCQNEYTDGAPSAALRRHADTARAAAIALGNMPMICPSDAPIMAELHAAQNAAMDAAAIASQYAEWIDSAIHAWRCDCAADARADDCAIEMARAAMVSAAKSYDAAMHAAPSIHADSDALTGHLDTLRGCRVNAIFYANRIDDSGINTDTARYAADDARQAAAECDSAYQFIYDLRRAANAELARAAMRAAAAMADDSARDAAAMIADEMAMAHSFRAMAAECDAAAAECDAARDMVGAYSDSARAARDAAGIARDAADAAARQCRAMAESRAAYESMADAATDAYSAAWNAADMASAAGCRDIARAAYALCDAAICPNAADDMTIAELMALLPAQNAGLHAIARQCIAAADDAAADMRRRIDAECPESDVDDYDAAADALADACAMADAMARAESPRAAIDARQSARAAYDAYTAAFDTWQIAADGEPDAATVAACIGLAESASAYASAYSELADDMAREIAADDADGRDTADAMRVYGIIKGICRDAADSARMASAAAYECAGFIANIGLFKADDADIRRLCAFAYDAGFSAGMADDAAMPAAMDSARAMHARAVAAAVSNARIDGAIIGCIAPPTRYAADDAQFIGLDAAAIWQIIIPGIAINGGAMDSARAAAIQPAYQCAIAAYGPASAAALIDSGLIAGCAANWDGGLFRYDAATGRYGYPYAAAIN